MSEAPPRRFSLFNPLSILRIKQVWGHSPSWDVTGFPFEYEKLTPTPPRFNPNWLWTPHRTGAGGGCTLTLFFLQQRCTGFLQGLLSVFTVMSPKRFNSRRLRFWNKLSAMACSFLAINVSGSHSSKSKHS